MTREERNEEERARREHSLDTLAKGLANDTISRRDALKWVGAAIVGGLLSAIPGVAWGAPPRTPPGHGGTPPGLSPPPPPQESPPPPPPSESPPPPPPVPCPEDPAGFCEPGFHCCGGTGCISNAHICCTLGWVCIPPGEQCCVGLGCIPSDYVCCYYSELGYCNPGEQCCPDV